MNLKLNSAVAVLVIALLLPSIAAAQLQWFGYAGGGDDTMLDRTVTYINFGYFSTDEDPRSTAVFYRIDAMTQREMKAIVELGQLLWEPGTSGTYQSLYTDYVDRWNTWKTTNAPALTGDKVLGFLVRDEPFLNKVDISQLEAASQMIKRDFPWAKIILIEAADAVYDSDPLSHFNQNRARLSTVDWIGVDRYYIDPTTDIILRDAVVKLKQSYPGRKTIYVADGFWNQAHVNLGGDLNIMRSIMTKWYDVARNDPDAVLLAVFIWNSGGEITVGSDSFPPFVIDEHIRVGKAITGRVRTQLYQPIGVFEGFDSNYNAVGWACDPDSNWGEKVSVDFYEVGSGLLVTTIADKSSEFFPQCRSGMAHRFRMPTPVSFLGKKILAFAHDLDSGVAQLPSTCLDAPACTMYWNHYRPIGKFKISSTGFAEGWTCDPDAPQASIKLEVWVDTTPPNGTRVSTALANLTSDETINGQCGGGTAHRFGVQLPSWTKDRGIYIYGIDTMLGSAFLLTAPDSGCPGVGVCIW